MTLLSSKNHVYTKSCCTSWKNWLDMVCILLLIVRTLFVLFYGFHIITLNLNLWKILLIIIVQLA